MIWEWQGQRHETTAVIYKVTEEYGDLSNMCNEFPLQIAGQDVKSSEALFHACKFPKKPDWQEEILKARHAMEAKMKAKKAGRMKEARPDWDEVCVAIMKWVLRIKLASHPRRITALVRWSGTGPIVEQSKNDAFWGAIAGEDGVLRGENHLGRIWTEIRDDVRAFFNDGSENQLLTVPPPDLKDMLLLGKPIETFVGTGDFGSRPGRK